MCERAHDRFEMAKTKDAGLAIGLAFYIVKCKREGCESFYEEDLEMAEVQYKHALRRLKRSYPGEFCALSESSWWAMVKWATRMHALGFAIPVAEHAAAKMEMCLERPAARWLMQHEACGKCEHHGDTGPNGCMCAYTRPSY